MTEMVDAALAYAARGWAVFPLHHPVSKGTVLLCSCDKLNCQTPAKHPMGTKHGVLEATRDPEQIRAWWKKHPLANIGIAMGQVSGLVAVDLDGKEAKNTFKSMFPDLDFERIPRQRTGRPEGGWHLIFQSPAVPIKNASGILPKTDFRGEHGYIVGAPSVHISGRPYVWQIPPSQNIPQLTPALYELIKSRASDGNGQHKPLDTPRALAGVPEGQRDETLFKLACKLRHADVPQEMAEALILDAAANCQPAFPEREALAKVESAFRRYEPFHGEPKAIEAKKERTPITIRVSDVQREEVSWLWRHRIPRGKLTIIEGDPGVGKSCLSLAIATAVTRGVGLPGEAEQKEPEAVLIMSAEDGLADTIRPRLEDMGADISKVFQLRGLRDEEGLERPLTLADLDVIEKAIVEHRPALVIVDPIIAYTAGKDTHKANEVRSLLAPLAALAEKHKVAIVAIRHLNKGTAKATYRGQGNIDFLAACRSAFLAGENPENPGEKVLCHIKTNLGPKTPSLTYTIDEGRFRWGEESPLTAEQILAVAVESGERNKIEEAKVFLEDALSAGPVASSEIEKDARGAGIAPRTLKRAKTVLGIKPRKASFGGGWIWELPDRRRPKNPEEDHSKRMAPFGDDGLLRQNAEGWEDLP